ncbi:bifunctional (p)ppGpp synthetase/guanosine-3',5'-bis(diphosphate) 3'-pyrophosphohydrolase [Candidatus Gracilibacteria bacterium]|nr:bifunctional (p)ppGpp synthetase/guanosine-3',5'-bis(diphosphate) 3'-pyrophosphohydrolase [Candidatus Gracilibacteria bacterium]
MMTPKGDVIDLPVGATPIDFGYRIHEQIGSHAVRAIVNNSPYKLTNELHSGDIVEIQTDKNQSPKQDWLRHVKTHQASHQIKYRLRKQSSSGPPQVNPSYNRQLALNKFQPVALSSLQDTIPTVTGLQQQIKFGMSSTISLLFYEIKSYLNSFSTPGTLIIGVRTKQALKGCHSSNGHQYVDYGQLFSES